MTSAELKRLEAEHHEDYIENLQANLDMAEFNNIELVIKLREVAADLEVVWSR
jgi:hypothetical protein